MRFLLALLAFSLPLIAAESGLHDEVLLDVKASISLPAGWKSCQETDGEEGVFVYHFGGTVDSGGAEIVPVTMSVTTKVPERAEQKPSEYAAALLDIPLDDGASAPVQKVVLNGMVALRTEYDFEGDRGRMRAVSVALPNDQSGTLYFFTWQAPLDEPLEMEALREKVLASIKIDSGF